MSESLSARVYPETGEVNSFICQSLEAGEVAPWHWNMDTGDLQLANNFAAVARISLVSLNKKNLLLDLIVPADRDFFLRTIEECLYTEAVFSCALRLYDNHKSLLKKPHWIGFKGRAYRDVNGQRIVCGVVAETGKTVFQSVREEIEPTDNHQREDRLRDQNHLLYSILNNTNSAITAKCQEGKYLLANQEFCTLTGKSQEEILGKTDFDLFDQQMAREIRQFDALTLERKKLLQLEESLSFCGGELTTYLSVRFPIADENGNPYAVGLVATDISNRKMIEQTIEQQRRELRVLLDSMRACIWYLDIQGRVISCNRLAKQWLPGAHAVGKDFMEISTGWDDRAQSQREILQVAHTGIAQLGSVERCRRANGEECWLNVDKIPIKKGSGEVTGTLLVVNDITENVLKEKALLESEARYRAFIGNSAEAIWRYDITPPVKITLPASEQVEQIVAGARLAECNKVMARMCGVGEPEQAQGLTLAGSGSESYLLDVEVFVKQDYRLTDWEFTCRDPQGRQLHMQISAIGIVEDNRLIRVWGNTRDITTRSRYLARLEHQANHDSLTGLPNRNILYREMGRLFLEKERLEKERLENAGDEKGPYGEVRDGIENHHKCALLLIDLDHFKEINDTLGHPAGDKLLKQVGARLKSAVSELPGVAVRLGGDEFAVFLSQISGACRAEEVGYQVLGAIRKEFDLDGFCTEVSASIGISIFPDQARDVSTMMRYADVAMYRAKTEMLGVSTYNPELDPHSPKRLALMGDLGRAIRGDQLLLHFQPKVDLKRHCVYGFEALLRWSHPQLGFVPPGEFIPIVEMTDLIHPMTLWVLENSIKQCAGWHARGFAVSVAVNLSARNLLEERIAARIEALLHKYGLAPRWLELEITESAIMADPARALRALKLINDLGVGLSIDDFGTGYSSLVYLKRLPVQALKIDYSFVVNMLEEEQDAIIVNSTINLAHNLGLTVVAEGVESQSVLQRLRAMGCDQAQGYFISRPLAADRIPAWVEDSEWWEAVASQ